MFVSKQLFLVVNDFSRPLLSMCAALELAILNGALLQVILHTFLYSKIA